MRVDARVRVGSLGSGMRLVQHLRRLAPALLAVALLLVSFASAGHSHGASGASGATIAADARATGSEFDCALCAAASRLAHGAAAAPAPFPALASHAFAAARAGDLAPPRVDLSRSEARAPPRLG